MNPLENLIIRPLKREDLETIVKIDEKILGENRRDYWDLLQFFHAMGFTRGDMLNLELKI
jgi:hypothetical protein